MVKLKKRNPIKIYWSAKYGNKRKREEKRLSLPNAENSREGTKFGFVTQSTGGGDRKSDGILGGGGKEIFLEEAGGGLKLRSRL